jgi:PilZ domain-containing protein
MRAPRFPLHLSVKYRRIGDPEWRRGETENISRSGVLIRSEDPLELDATVELLVALDVRSAGADAAEVLCCGRVVRTVSPSDNYSWPGSAVAIEQFNFLPPDVDSLSAEMR